MKDIPVNFGGLPDEYSGLKNASIVVLPVPFDGTSTWIKGADRGPEALIEASANMELYDIETDSEVYTRGIFTARAIREKKHPEKMVKQVEKKVGDFLAKDKFVVTLGGEHSVSVGAIRAHAAFHEGLTVLQLDAHSDMRPEYEGSAYNHACAMARAVESAPVVQVGIRSMDAGEKEFIRPERIFYAEKRMQNPAWMDQAVGLLSDKVYLTIDLDVFDPSIMPSTGTPEPGGLFWYEVLELIRRVNAKSTIVGFDVVELCPDKRNKAPDFLAAKLVYKILSYRFAGK